MKRLSESFSSLIAAAVLTASLGAAQSASPLADAAMRGDKAAVQTLLKQGADVNAAQGDGMTRAALGRRARRRRAGRDAGLRRRQHRRR